MENLISRRKAFEYFVTLWECIGTIMDRDEWEDVCMTTANEIPSAQPEQRWIPVTEIPPYGKDLMLKLHDRRRGCDCFYYYVMGLYDGDNYQTYLFRYQDDHDLEVVEWQLCPWEAGEQE